MSYVSINNFQPYIGCTLMCEIKPFTAKKQANCPKTYFSPEPVLEFSEFSESSEFSEDSDSCQRQRYWPLPSVARP